MLTSRFTHLLILLTAPLALMQCVPSPAPYTAEKYNITEYYETLASQRPPDTDSSIFGFTFHDPNTCFGPIQCVHEWRRGLGEPGPRDAWWSCSAEHPEVQVLHTYGEFNRNGVLQIKYKYLSVDANNAITEYKLHGNGTLYSTGHCSSSGTCRYGWGGVPSLLDVVEEDDLTEESP